MKLPTSVDIAGFTYTISTDSDELAHAGQAQRAVLLGNCDRQQQRILVKVDVCDQVQAETLVHEMLHALTELVGLADELDDDREEQIVQRLAPALALTIARNPEMCQTLAEVFS